MKDGSSSFSGTGLQMVSDLILYYKLQTLPASEYSLTHEVGISYNRDRIVSLTDAVLAIIMTLLVLGIVIPQPISSRSPN